MAFCTHHTLTGSVSNRCCSWNKAVHNIAAFTLLHCFSSTSGMYICITHSFGCIWIKRRDRWLRAALSFFSFIVLISHCFRVHDCTSYQDLYCLFFEHHTSSSWQCSSLWKSSNSSCIGLVSLLNLHSVFHLRRFYHVQSFSRECLCWIRFALDLLFIEVDFELFCKKK